MKLSRYAVGWIGLRVERLGSASHALISSGWIKQHHADLYNRNAFDWVRPVQTREQFEATDWRPLSNLGLSGMAFWITDAQWGKNAGITDAQWMNRAIIEAEFNRNLTHGRREKGGAK